MRVLVTGGAGFIGSHVVDRLLRSGHEPLIYDLVRSPYHGPSVVEAVRGDLLDADRVQTAMQGCDVVVHLAAVADVNLVVADPTRAERVNVRGTQVVLEAARNADVGRLLYGSTVWVYGNGEKRAVSTEDSPLVRPPHLYTATKLAGEMYCHSYGALYGLEHTILRFGIPFGPRARAATVVAAFVARARAGKALTIAGDGNQERQFVYVDDLAAGVVSALAPPAAWRTYNLVGDESVSVRQIADVVRGLVAKVPIVHSEERSADLHIGHVSGSRAAEELGWTPATSFAEGVRLYVDWVTATSGSPVSPTAATMDGRAATILRQQPGEL